MNISIRYYSIIITFFVFYGSFSFVKAQDSKLIGSILSDDSVNPSNPSLFAFDGDGNTFYMSNQASHAWVGLDLGSKHIITRFRWLNSPGTYDMKFYIPWAYKTVKKAFSFQAIIEGANSSDFSDAVPLYMITEESSVASWQETLIKTTRGFRYVRYVGPNSSFGKISDIEFYGFEGAGDDSQLYQISNLPTVSVHVTTGEDPINKVDELLSYSSVVSESGTKIVEGSSTLRLRGNSTMKFDKKPYRLKFDEKQKMPSCSYKARKWCLVPNLDDKSLMRNMIGFEVSQSVGLEYTPYCQPVDLVVNGEYKGNYQLCDLVSVNKNRIDIEEIDTEAHSDASQFGWFIEIDKLANEEPTGNWFNSAKGIPVTIKSPDSKEINSLYLDAIKTHFDKLESCVYNAQLDTLTGVRHYLDMDSFERYFLASEFMVNSDAYHSIFLHKHIKDDRFYVGPVWDLNLSMNNDSRFYDVNSRKRWSYFESSADAGTIRTFLTKMFDNDPTILQEVKNLWATIRNSDAVSTDRLLFVIDSLATDLHSSQEQNFKRWDVLSDKLFWNKYSYGSFQGEINALKNAISGRVNWMDGMLNCSPNDIEINIPESGWATIYLPLACVVPEELSFYTVSEIGGVDEKRLIHYTTAFVASLLSGDSYQSFDFNEDGSSDVGDIIRLASNSIISLQLINESELRANCPYIVHGRPGTYYLSGYQTDSWPTTANGFLVGVRDAQYAPLGSYILDNEREVAVFRKVEDENSFEVKPNTAYLVLPNVDDLNVNTFYLPFDIVWGIEDLVDESKSETIIYTIDGKSLYKTCAHNLNADKIINQFGLGVYIVSTGGQQQKIVVMKNGSLS